jgi:GT2 family glycosyltransferase
VSSDFRVRLREIPKIPKVCEGKGEPGLVSVLIPTYNRAYILRQAIASVFAQTYRPIEVVVVDDGSTDNTRQIISEMKQEVRYIYQENGGLASARNTGLAAARGEFIAFQDSDDLWMPWKLEVQVALLRKYPQVAVIGTDLNVVNAQGKVVAERQLRKIFSAFDRIDHSKTFTVSGNLKDICPNCPADLVGDRYECGDIYTAMFHGNLIHPPTALMRRENLQTIGGLDVNFTSCGEDYEFLWRLTRTGWAATIDSPGILYRVGAEDQYTKPDNILLVAHGYLQALLRSLKADGSKLQLSDDEKRKCLADAYAWIGEQELKSSRGRFSAGYFFKSLRIKPLQPRVLFLLPFSLVPKPILSLAQLLKRNVRKLISRRKVN